MLPESVLRRGSAKNEEKPSTKPPNEKPLYREIQWLPFDGDASVDREKSTDLESKTPGCTDGKKVLLFGMGSHART